MLHMIQHFFSSLLTTISSHLVFDAQLEEKKTGFIFCKSEKINKVWKEITVVSGESMKLVQLDCFANLNEPEQITNFHT